jgi:hypothetical protein
MPKETDLPFAHVWTSLYVDDAGLWLQCHKVAGLRLGADTVLRCSRCNGRVVRTRDPDMSEINERVVEEWYRRLKELGFTV